VVITFEGDIGVHQSVKFLLLVQTLLLPVLLVPQAHAADNTVDISGITSQDVFGDLVKDLGAAVSYKSVAPAEPLGTLGFDFSFEVSGTSVENKSSFDQAVTGGNAPSTLYVPKLHVHKGLPLGFDVGAFYTSVPTTNMNMFGGELRYAILEGNTVMPALAVRGTYSRLSGVTNLDLNTTGLELSISKGFAMFTPYAGIGTVRYSGDASGTTLTQERISETKYFLGLNFNLGLVNFAAETEQTGDNSTTSAKIGVRF
jgi:hypothetical protein